MLGSLRRIENLTADECESYAAALMADLRGGRLSREVYEALEDALDRRCAAARGIATIL